MAPTNFYTSSPTVVLPPTPVPDQYFNHGHYAGSMDTEQPVNNATDAIKSNQSSSAVEPAPGSLAGRKRSRGDIHAPDEDPEDELSDTARSSHPPSPSKMHHDPVVDSAMSLDHPNGLAHQQMTECQSSASTEGQSQRKLFELGHLRRPSVASRKSQRLDSQAGGSEDLAHLVLPPTMREVTQEPLIDEATRMLGISWTRMDKTEALRIGQAAYTKWIINHYPSLQNVNVWFENSAIPGYLASARNVYNGLQEFYIFSNDLTEARLVTSEPSQLVPRLQMLPALHLAAPGGCIRAETDPITASQNAVDNTLVNGICAAHAMEMD